MIFKFHKGFHTNNKFVIAVKLLAKIAVIFYVIYLLNLQFKYKQVTLMVWCNHKLLRRISSKILTNNIIILINRNLNTTIL